MDRTAAGQREAGQYRQRCPKLFRSLGYTPTCSVSSGAGWAGPKAEIGENRPNVTSPPRTLGRWSKGVVSQGRPFSRTEAPWTAAVIRHGLPESGRIGDEIFGRNECSR